MVKGVQDVYYNVQNMERAVTFYRDVLGLNVMDEDTHFTALEAGGVRIGLHWTGAQPFRQSLMTSMVLTQVLP